jgi:hypothetical protein
VHVHVGRVEDGIGIDHFKVAPSTKFGYARDESRLEWGQPHRIQRTPPAPTTTPSTQRQCPFEQTDSAVATRMTRATPPALPSQRAGEDADNEYARGGLRRAEGRNSTHPVDNWIIKVSVVKH